MLKSSSPIRGLSGRCKSCLSRNRNPCRRHSPPLKEILCSRLKSLSVTEKPPATGVPTRTRPERDVTNALRIYIWSATVFHSEEPESLGSKKTELYRFRFSMTRWNMWMSIRDCTLRVCSLLQLIMERFG